MLDVKTLTVDEIVTIRDALKQKIAGEPHRFVKETDPARATRDMIMNLDFEIFERAVNHKRPYTN